ncbi:hypothetical protein [Aquibium oceanicum]|uniref:Uncharacterized protein n=1 Tax=Aquibium oceanicum TaxID=1670800 RepID=A0A1L3SRU2_9HYPH|nr:hypothetical protein [Aquibium oceanicum]APH72124.1 hypothetical protein BSQ44_12695 [Aquibium oceanicum]
MHVHAAMGDERMLRRIIALLVSFAAMAEQAATRSAPVRWFVLCLLLYAEKVAESFVIEAAGLPLSELEVIALDGKDPDDALSLAARFYALAAALCTLLPLRDLFERQPERRVLACGHAAPGSTCRFSGRGWKPNDTS